MDVVDFFIMAKGNTTIQSSFAKALNQYRRHSNIAVSISGGKDSDLILDIMSKIDNDKKIRYIWFDTGIEYQATKDHLSFLERKYNIKIERIKAIKPVPFCCKKYGQPFLTKYDSEMISRLQRHNFTFKDGKFEELYQLYPKCRSALKWWCNQHGEKSRLNINYHKYLKQFLIDNPPKFKISPKCCDYAKKQNSHIYVLNNNIDLMITGIRKKEGGIRSISFKSCFSQDEICDNYRPIFWYSSTDISDYDRIFGTIHSDCYTIWGLARTGCAACPYGLNYEHELKLMKQYEPRLYNACLNIFKDSYEYTKQYKEYVAKCKQQEKEDKS